MRRETRVSFATNRHLAGIVRSFTFGLRGLVLIRACLLSRACRSAIQTRLKRIYRSVVTGVVVVIQNIARNLVCRKVSGAITDAQYVQAGGQLMLDGFRQIFQGSPSCLQIIETIQAGADDFEHHPTGHKPTKKERLGTKAVAELLKATQEPLIKVDFEPANARDLACKRATGVLTEAQYQAAYDSWADRKAQYDLAQRRLAEQRAAQERAEQEQQAELQAQQLNAQQEQQQLKELETLETLEFMGNVLQPRTPAYSQTIIQGPIFPPMMQTWAVASWVRLKVIEKRSAVDAVKRRLARGHRLTQLSPGSPGWGTGV